MSKGPTIGDWTQHEWIPDDASSFPARVRLRNAAWMVYYEPDAVVQRERAERLELREQNAELRDENAKLRELLQRLLAEYRYLRVRPRKMYLQHEQRMRAIEDEMCELGIEVPE